MRVPWIVYPVPWTARRSNQSILKDINPEYSFEELRLKLKLRYYDHLDSILKSLDITLLAKIHIDKAMVLPVVMHRCEGWTIKKAEH